MCGIAGYVSGSNRRPFAKLQASVLGTLSHRGPDDAGWMIEGHSGTGDAPREPGRWGLFHRRLSILDLSPLGHQPMSTPDGRYSIVFNGEIYNYLELRQELEREGCIFRSHSDTEVLLWAYMRWGKNCLTRLVGMFAFAIVDAQQANMFLARDFFGIKPLYYTRPEGGFAFASEIKALRPLVSGRVNAARLFRFLRDGLIDQGAETLLADVHQLPAAHWMEVDLKNGTPGEPHRYWDVDLDRRSDLSFAEAVERTRELFLDSVRLHLRSDVPVGAALSGGTDSSAIVAAMRMLEPNAEIHTFSFVTDDPVIGEERYADIAGNHARAIVHKVRLSPGDLAADLDRLVAVQDEPFGSTSIYAQYRVFRLAAEHKIKVMLDGQGADEMLAGYHGYYDARIGSLIGRGRWLQAYQLAVRASRRPGVGGSGLLMARGIRRLLPSGLQTRGQAMFGKATMPEWLNASWFDQHGVVPEKARRTTRLTNQLRERLHDTLTATSLPMLLRYEDRNSMAWSIESRVPFLTPALSEFLLSLPEEYLISRHGETKHVFREAMRGIVPNEILDRRDKIGFATPEKRWLQELRPWLAEVLSPDRVRQVAALNEPAVTRDWQDVLDGKRPFDWRVWRWVNLVRWTENMGVTFE
ncbi:MAG: asparagine synthase (glutamine-hydrolyzing) [Gemmataceae bacterium]|nr:asparagine synthase (glutamine-hydrolyzing) [Gemmataceae bacterium]